MGVLLCVCKGVLRIQANKFTDTCVQFFATGKITYTYIRTDIVCLLFYSMHRTSLLAIYLIAC